MKNFFDTFVEFVTNGQLEEIAQKDEIFCGYDNQLNELYQKFAQIELPKEEKEVIVDLLETQVAQSARMTDLACKRAAVELVEFLKMIRVLRETEV